MQTDTMNGAAQAWGHPTVFEPSWLMKIMIAFVGLLFVALALFFVAIALSAGRSDGPGLMIFMLVMAGAMIALLAVLRPATEAIFGTRIVVGAGQLALRLPERRKAPAQPKIDMTLPLASVEKVATRIEMMRGMGQIMQMRMFALKTASGWIEFGGVQENNPMNNPGAAGRVAMQSATAIAAARGIGIEDHGVVEGASKSKPGTPWGMAGLAAPAAEVSLVKASKNADLWRTILTAVIFLVVIAKLLVAFSR